MNIWEVWETQETGRDADGNEGEIVLRSVSRRDARDRLYLLRSSEDEIRTRVDGIERRCARLLAAAASSPLLQRVLTRGGEYAAGSHHRDSIIMARHAVYRRIFGKPEPPLRKSYELRGPFLVTDLGPVRRQPEESTGAMALRIASAALLRINQGLSEDVSDDVEEDVFKIVCKELSRDD